MYNVSVLPRVQLSVSNLLLLYPCILQNCYKKKKKKKITTPYAGFEGMLLSMCEKLTIEKLKISLLPYKSV